MPVSYTHLAAKSFKATMETNADITNSLSARGSMNFPKLETMLYFLAILPSSISVKDATIKIITAIYLFIGSGARNSTSKNAGIITTRDVYKRQISDGDLLRRRRFASDRCDYVTPAQQPSYFLWAVLHRKIPHLRALEIFSHLFPDG